jgi:endonuclease YncB( thermonuclease family)
MKHLLPLLLLALPLACQGAGPPVLQLTAPGKIVNVVDGDTVDIQYTFVVRGRLLGCWVPDKNKPINERAEDDLVMYVGGEEVITQIPLDKAESLKDLLTLNRVLMQVWKKGDTISLSEWQVKRGNASSQKNLPLGK